MWYRSRRSARYTRLPGLQSVNGFPNSSCPQRTSSSESRLVQLEADDLKQSGHLAFEQMKAF
jgi:hypothetical protein